VDAVLPVCGSKLYDTEAKPLHHRGEQLVKCSIFICKIHKKPTKKGAAFTAPLIHKNIKSYLIIGKN
jgi:hypothetical protein